MVFVYVIKSDIDGRYYVGIARSVEKRLKQHNAGVTKSTKGYRPWKLEFIEPYDNWAQARKREIYLKSGIGKEFIKSKRNL
jgi:putative endonuclease